MSHLNGIIFMNPTAWFKMLLAMEIVFQKFVNES